MALFGGISYKDKTFITRQLAVMIESGLPVAQGVRYLSEQTSNPALKDILMVILRDLENGYKFSDAVKKHPKVFDNVFTSVIAAGESSGKLSEVLNMLAVEQERELGFRSKVVGAMLYPAFIVGAMIVVAIIMVTKIIPVLSTVFEESGVQLPWTTKLVIAVTNSMINFWYIYIVVVAGLIFVIGRYVGTNSGRKELSAIMLKVPVLKILVVNMEMTRLTRVLGMLIKAGVPIIQAINSVAEILGNVLYQEALLQVSHNVERGAPIAQSMLRTQIFPPTISQMVGVGEQTGKLEDVLAKLSKYYEEELDQSVKNITSLMEPIVFVIVGLGVAFLVFAIIMPIYNLGTAIQ